MRGSEFALAELVREMNYTNRPKLMDFSHA